MMTEWSWEGTDYSKFLHYIEIYKIRMYTQTNSIPKSVNSLVHILCPTTYQSHSDSKVCLKTPDFTEAPFFLTESCRNDAKNCHTRSKLINSTELQLSVGASRGINFTYPSTCPSVHPSARPAVQPAAYKTLNLE